MSDFDWLVIQLQLLVFGFIGFVLFMVLAPVALIAAKVNENRKKRQEEANRLSATEPQPTAPAVMVSQEDGRVIAMEAPAPTPVVPPAVTPRNQGFHPLMNFALQVLGKVAVTVVMGQLKPPHHKK